MAQERSNEELCILAQQGDEGACLQLLKQNRAYIVEQMTKMKFRYHPYWQETLFDNLEGNYIDTLLAHLLFSAHS